MHQKSDMIAGSRHTFRASVTTKTVEALCWNKDGEAGIVVIVKRTETNKLITVCFV
jgi:hypothetical protein